MIAIPHNRRRAFWANELGQVFFNTTPPGEPFLRYFKLILPTAEETRTALLRLRKDLGLSRAQLAISLGIGKDTLRRWETGERKPCAAARKLVRLIEIIYFSQESIGMEFGGSIIGRISLEALNQLKSKLLPQPTASNA